MELKEQAKELVAGLQGVMAPSVYDAAWMARLQVHGTPCWPELVDWLIERQRPDGSWGGEIPYYHDRILCTLAVIIALKEQADGRPVAELIARGERYIWNNLHRLRHDPFELVGFELIMPTLLMEALDLGLDIPVHTCGYGRIRQDKLALIPPEMIYSPQVTTVHSLEFMGKEGDLARMQAALSINGSLGNSPATTCYYLLRDGSSLRAWHYLEGMLEHNRHVVYLYPCYTFHLTWVLHNLTFCNGSLTDLVGPATWERLRGEISAMGIGLDPTFGIEDGDITSVTTRLLTLAGDSIDPAILARFEDKRRHIFRTYEYERNIGVSTNIHALEAVNALADYPRRDEVVDQVLAFLMANRVYDTYWLDKWNASPYYVTAHALAGILGVEPRLLHECRHTVDWLMHTQRDDGSWGFFDTSTVEETAYAMIGLFQYYRHRPFEVDRDVLDRGARYLYRSYRADNRSYPELYIGKCLFAPQEVVHATVLAAMILYEENVGHSPE